MNRWLTLLLISSVSLIITACTAKNQNFSGLTGSVPAYIYNFPPKYSSGFLLVAFSANGNVTVGTTDERNYWIWSKSSGTTIIPTMPANYQIKEDSVAVNSDGTVIAGILVIPWPHNKGTASEIFRWTAATGVQILPALAVGDFIQELALSSDGNTISFLCTGPNGLPCNDKSFQPGGNNRELKTWTAKEGYQSVGPNFGKNHNFIHPSSDLKTFLFSNYRQVGNRIYTDPFGLMDETGKIIVFRPPLHEYNPYFIHSNKENSLVSDNTLQHGPGWNSVIYNASGEMIEPKIPKNCSNLTVLAIDGNSDIFGEAYCGAPTPTGLRISKGKAEIIANWLKDAGLNYNFPSDTVVWKVSDNGTTVQGFLDPGVSSCGCSKRILSKPPATTGPPGSEEGFGQGNSFIAHVP